MYQNKAFFLLISHFSSGTQTQEGKSEEYGAIVISDLWERDFCAFVLLHLSAAGSLEPHREEQNKEPSLVTAEVDSEKSLRTNGSRS